MKEEMIRKLICGFFGFHRWHMSRDFKYGACERCGAIIGIDLSKD